MPLSSLDFIQIGLFDHTGSTRWKFDPKELKKFKRGTEEIELGLEEDIEELLYECFA
jgi:hypothetical protein